MVKFDVSILRYLTKDHFRVLSAVEMGMRNHEWVPIQLINSIAKLKRGGAFQFLNFLHKHKLVVHKDLRYDGYMLTYSGYDFLALRAFRERGIISGVGQRIGVGKESDVYICENEEGRTLVLKLERLGRTSFRKVKEKRDYLQKRKTSSWLYLSRLAALREFAYMKALHDRGFPVPEPVDVNRHAIVMEFVPGYPLSQICELDNPGETLEVVLGLILRLAEVGIVHGDLNEFNLIIGENDAVTLIDFPQMVSVDHLNAREQFDRDVRCCVEYWVKRYHYHIEEVPAFDDVARDQEVSMGAEMQLSGYSKDKDDEFFSMLQEQREDSGDSADSDDSDDEEEEEEEKEKEEEEEQKVGDKEEDEDDESSDEKDGDEDDNEEDDEDGEEKGKEIHGKAKRVVQKKHQQAARVKVRRNRYKDRGRVKGDPTKKKIGFF